MQHELSTTGKHLLENLEGLRLTRYMDGTGHPTIGYGHQMRLGDPSSITIDEAVALLQSDVKPVVDILNHELDLAPSVVLTQNQFDALCLFVFNIGIGAWTISTCRKVVMANQLYKVPEQLSRWTRGDRGQIIQGLVKRRNAEIKLFTS